MSSSKDRKLARLKRKMRVRAKVRGTAERPRLCVYRSNAHLYAQVINDETGSTLAAASTLSPELKGQGLRGKKAAEMLGELIARKAKESGIEKVVFDRNGYIYLKGGVIATLADSARKGGLVF